MGSEAFKRLLTSDDCSLVLLAATFTGLINAIRSFQDDLKQHHVTIWVRRAGPNYQQGLKMMRECALKTGLDIHIYGPETHVTAIVPLALGLAKIEDYSEFDSVTYGKPAGPTVSEPSSPVPKRPRGLNENPLADEDEDSKPPASFVPAKEADHEADHHVENFTAMTRCVVYGLQLQAVQGMLDFDHMCRRSRPSVAAIIFPYSSNHLIKLYWGTDEILLPVYQSMNEALSKHPEVTVVVNFASFRSVYSSVLEVLDNHSNQIRTVAIIAEGVPESQTRSLIKKAKACNVGIIGPATVGGIKPGCFRIGKCLRHCG
jgi:ATP citrate (pro-S)-lyase